MNSKSLPTSFKHYDYRKKAIKNNKTISSGNHGSLTEVIKNENNFNYTSSINSSYVRVSSPLTRQTFLNNTDLPLYPNGTSSDKSWATYGWSTLSGSLTTQRRKLKKQLTRSWNNRRTRRTFPPSKDLLKKEKKKFSFTSSLNKKSTNNTRKYRHTQPNNKNRQSLQDILSQFTAYEEAMKKENDSVTATKTIDHDKNKSISRKSKIGSMSMKITNTVTSYSSLSKKLEKALKKNGKRRYRRKNRPPSLFILKNDEDTKSSANNPYFIFQPPTTVSSQTSTPITPLKFPTPPKRFSAYYVDLEGNINKTEYKRPSNIIEESARVLQKLYSILPLQQKSKDDLVFRQQYNQQLLRNSSLFVFGFLFCPFWWLGTLLYISKKKELLLLKKQQDQQARYYVNEYDLMSPHTFGYLNGIFSCVSLALIAVIIALLIML